MLVQISGFAAHLQLDLAEFKLDEPKFVTSNEVTAMSTSPQGGVPPTMSTSTYPPCSDETHNVAVPDGTVVVVPTHRDPYEFPASHLSCLAILETEASEGRQQAQKYAFQGTLSTNIATLMRNLRARVKALEDRLKQQQGECQSGESGLKKYVETVVAEHKAFRQRKYACVEGSAAEQQMDAYLAKTSEEVCACRCTCTWLCIHCTCTRGYAYTHGRGSG